MRRAALLRRRAFVQRVAGVARVLDDDAGVAKTSIRLAAGFVVVVTRTRRVGVTVTDGVAVAVTVLANDGAQAHVRVAAIRSGARVGRVAAAGGQRRAGAIRRQGAVAGFGGRAVALLA